MWWCVLYFLGYLRKNIIRCSKKNIRHSQNKKKKGQTFFKTSFFFSYHINMIFKKSFINFFSLREWIFVSFFLNIILACVKYFFLMREKEIVFFWVFLCVYRRIMRMFLLKLVKTEEKNIFLKSYCLEIKVAPQNKKEFKNSSFFN